MTDPRFPGTFNIAQTKQLLEAINPRRVLRDGKGNSHVSHQDIVAHLTRIFGYGNWATEVLYCEPIFETPRVAEPVYNSRWDVAYRAVVRLTIFDENHNVVTNFEDASVGDAQNQVRHDAHDLAMKSAISLALKRCAKNLGDQFGLSLYNKGQTSALVMGTKILPKKFAEDQEPQVDLQEGIPQQESLGYDEVEKKVEAEPEQEAQIAASLPAPTPTAGITKPQIAKIGVLFAAAKITDRAESIAKVISIIGRDIESRNDLTKDEAGKVIDVMEEEAAVRTVQEGLGAGEATEEPKA